MSRAQARGAREVRLAIPRKRFQHGESTCGLIAAEGLLHGFGIAFACRELARAIGLCAEGVYAEYMRRGLKAYGLRYRRMPHPSPKAVCSALDHAFPILLASRPGRDEHFSLITGYTTRNGRLLFQLSNHGFGKTLYPFNELYRAVLRSIDPASAGFYVVWRQ